MYFKMRSLSFLAAFFFCLQITTGQALPPIQNFGISDYGAGSQNWALSQDNNNHIFVGNNKGLLEYNGSAWKLHPSYNSSIIRSVKVIDDRIFTGFYMDFGYWERDATGRFQFQSLVKELKLPLIEDEHFWNIESRDEWILFQSLDRIYMYNTADSVFQVIDFKTTRAKIFNLKDGIYVQRPGQGLFEIRNTSLNPVSDHKVFKDELVIGVYQWQGQFVVITEKGSFFRWNGKDSIEEWQISSLDQFGELNLYSSLKLKNGGLILGTISNGFIHLDSRGRLVQSINFERGLNNNTVLSAFEDADENLWLGLDNGISIVNLNSAFRIFKDSKGKLGAVYASMEHDGWLYLGTNQGLFCKKTDDTGGFKMIRGTNGQVWSLQYIKGTLFCGHNKGTFTVEADKADLISDSSGTWFLSPVKSNDQLLIQGNYNGLSVLENRKGGWVFRNNISGFEISSRSFVFTKPNEITVNHEYKGIFQLEIDEKYTRVVDTFSIGRIGFDSSILKFKGRNLFSSNEGIHVLDADSRELVYEEFLSSIFYDPSDRMSGKLIVEPDQGMLWGFSETNIICVEEDSFDGEPSVTKIPIPKFFRQNQGLTGFENIHHLGDSKYIIGTSNGYVVLDKDKNRQRDYHVELNGVVKRFINGRPEEVSVLDEALFSSKENNLGFRFNVPEYEKYTEVNFQYRLEGLSDNWSPWTSETDVNYGNLSFGDYKFSVRARVGNELSENIAAYAFRIERPWYLSWGAFVTYSIGFVLLMLFIHRSYKRYYNRQKMKLIEENQKNLELTRLANEQEIVKLKNQQLKNDIDGKNRELAITTMSLINKSELLNGIKNDLSNLEDKSSRDQMIKVINKNLNNDHDWEYFQEAFNNADKDFLKKMHQQHPNLTPNDLKLCVYLRLNLSSKEIAPLLNISVRSVEIKRYRLRKKMSLVHEKSLVEYILEI
jgi:ligand-binding sensor domain-containing protein/DNA-binding CsgD family transcriptional regulator